MVRGKQMTTLQNKDKLDRLIVFHKELKSYQRSLQSKKELSAAQLRYRESLREKLVHKVGSLKTVVIELTGKEHIQRFGMVYNIWDVSLSPHRISNICDVALDYCIDAVNEAIGKLEADSTPAKLTKAAKDYGGRIVDKEFELIVKGTPDMLLTLIMNVTKELNSKGYAYSFDRTSGRPDYTNWDKTYFASYAISQGTEGQIGNTSFQLIPNDRTLLKSTQPENWNSSFQQFMDYLLAEFQRLGFTDLKKEKLAVMLESLPKAFISHGKESKALIKIQQFLSALGIQPIIVEAQPSLGKAVDDKVNYYLDQADFTVILATGDDSIESKLHPRQNVIHEIGLAQNKHAERIIYLLEEGAEFPSNISPKVWERFNQENMENAFLRINIELRAFGILKAVKP